MRDAACDAIWPHFGGDSGPQRADNADGFEFNLGMGSRMPGAHCARPLGLLTSQDAACTARGGCRCVMARTRVNCIEGVCSHMLATARAVSFLILLVIPVASFAQSGPSDPR